MKQLLIFCFLLMISFGIDLKQKEISDLKKEKISVTVEGAVKKSGTIELDNYSTVQDVIDITGLNEDADISTLNPMLLVNDKDVLIIPEKKDESEMPLISINTGDADELVRLPGIGTATAENIILYRQENGLFQELTDLMNVKGIGMSKYEKLKDLICL